MQTSLRSELIASNDLADGLILKHARILGQLREIALLQEDVLSLDDLSATIECLKTINDLLQQGIEMMDHIPSETDGELLETVRGLREKVAILVETKRSNA